MGKQLYVTNISFRATEEDLWKLFSVAGTVKHIKMLTDAVTGKFKGCGFVEMANAKEMKEAINTLDDALLIDRVITVVEARPMPPREQTAASSLRRSGPGNRPGGSRGKK